MVLLSLVSACLIGDNSDGDWPIIQASAGNYTQLSWVDAYAAFHEQISEQYAFGVWKNIDWYTLNDSIRPKIVLAMNTNDEPAYATALREYTNYLPDGHVSIQNGLMGNLIAQNLGGSYGFGIIGLDDGRVITHVVTAGGPAALAGMQVGDQILEWDDIAINTALSNTSTLWRNAANSLATNEHTLYEKYRSLVLDPIGTNSKIKFFNAGGGITTTATLTAANDNATILGKTGLWNKVDDDEPIKYEVMGSGYGYIMLGALESENPTFSYDYLSDKLKEAMIFLTARNVPGIVVDLRGNSGGSDDLAAEFSGYFYSESTVYEYQEYYNAYNGKFEIVLVDKNEVMTRNIPLYIEPQVPQYRGPVVALVNPLTVSSAEGVAMTIQNLSRGRVVGFYGTNGSFGMTGGKAYMPGGYLIEFPFGASLDKNKVIQLDSKNGVGGVIPDNRTSRTSVNVINYVNGQDVELAHAVTVLGTL